VTAEGLGAGLLVPEAGQHAARAALSAMLRVRAERLFALPWSTLPEGRALRSALHAALRADPGSFFAALRRPTAHVHFEAARFAPDPASSLRSGAATLLTELAALGALPLPITLPAPPRRVVLLGLRVVIEVPAPLELSRGVVRSGGRDRLAGAAASHVPIATRAAPDLVLARVDENPLAMDEAHPDKDGNALSLGGRDEAEWIASLAAAAQRAVQHLPAFAEEFALGLSQIVPVGHHEERHLSASYREAIGTVYMTLHPDPLTMTEALIHEFQHNKLNAALDLDPFLHNAFDELVSSPVRPDPRPLHGVLLAVHAFLPIAELLLRMRDADDPLAASPRFAARLLEIVERNHEGLGTLLAHGRPTAAGARMLAEMTALDQRHRASI
jgi:HEXXH motif-containing protein